MQIPSQSKGVNRLNTTQLFRRQVIPSQQFCTACMSVPPTTPCLDVTTGQESTSSCVQRCRTGMGDSQTTFDACCSPDNCQSSQDCCKQVCCEVKVT